MAHIEKFTQSGTFAQFKHDTRDDYTAEHIDPSRTPLNYNIGPDCDPWKFVKDKILMSKNSGGRVNTRTVATVSCIVTLPKDFDGDVGLFFETAKEFLDSKFGADNCASCWVHFDEQQPHMHWRGCPILETVKTDEHGHTKTVQQFNAKKVVNRSMLQKFHKELDDHLAGVFGYSVGVVNGVCTEGALTVPQLKKQQAKTDKLREEYAKLVGDYNALVGDYRALCKQVKTLRDTVARLEQKLKEYAHIADDILADDSQPERTSTKGVER